MWSVVASSFFISAFSSDLMCIFFHRPCRRFCFSFFPCRTFLFEYVCVNEWESVFSSQMVVIVKAELLQLLMMMTAMVQVATTECVFLLSLCLSPSTVVCINVRQSTAMNCKWRNLRNTQTHTQRRSVQNCNLTQLKWVNFHRQS